MRFNGQQRDIGYHGRQGRKEVDHGEEKRVCDGLCKDMLVRKFSLVIYEFKNFAL